MVTKKAAKTKKSVKSVRKVTRVGLRSLSITLPKELISELKWKEKQKLTIKRVRGGLLIKDWKK